MTDTNTSLLRAESVFHPWLDNSFRAFHGCLSSVAAGGCAVRHNPVCKDLFDRLVAKGKTKPAAYGTVARKLVQIIYDVLNDKTMFDIRPQNA